MDFIEEGRKTTKRRHGEIVIRLIIDIKKEQVYFVPQDINHPEYVYKVLLKISKAELSKNPDIASHFVGAAVLINESDEVEDMIVGVSGLETWLKHHLGDKPFHTKAQVNKAKDILLQYLIGRKIKFQQNYKLRMAYI